MGEPRRRLVPRSIAGQRHFIKLYCLPITASWRKDPWGNYMRQRILLCSTSALIASASTPAMACFPHAGPFNFDYGTRAETIVVGRITDYEKVQKECLAAGELIPLCRYSRIFVSVEQVLAGKADRIVSAIVDKHAAGGLAQGSNGLPRPAATGQVVIALEDLSASLNQHPRRKRNPDGTVVPITYPRWGLMTVVEEPCRSAFVFEADSEAARTFLAKWRQAYALNRSLGEALRVPLKVKP